MQIFSVEMLGAGLVFFYYFFVLFIIYWYIKVINIWNCY